MRVASVQEPPVTSPSPASRCQGTPQHQKTRGPKTTLRLPGLLPCVGPSAPGTGGGTGRRLPAGQTPLPPVPGGAGGQSCSSSGELSSPLNTPQSSRSPWAPGAKSICPSTLRDSPPLRRGRAAAPGAAHVPSAASPAGSGLCKRGDSRAGAGTSPAAAGMLVPQGCSTRPRAAMAGWHCPVAPT